MAEDEERRRLPLASQLKAIGNHQTYCKLFKNHHVSSGIQLRRSDANARLGKLGGGRIVGGSDIDDFSHHSARLNFRFSIHSLRWHSLVWAKRREHHSKS